jgi:hypothetical protein
MSRLPRAKARGVCCLKATLTLRRWIVLSALLGVVAYGGSEIGAATSPQARTAASASATQKNTIECNGKLAGTLVLVPAVVEAGGEIRVAVKNVGELTIYYGLDNRVQRRVDRRWKDATRDFYGTRYPGVRRILLSAPPGKRAGPRYNDLVDRIPVPANVKPGTYRVVKQVSGNDRLRPPHAKLDATFEVR